MELRNGYCWGDRLGTKGDGKSAQKSPKVSECRRGYNRDKTCLLPVRVCLGWSSQVNSSHQPFWCCASHLWLNQC